MRLQVVLGHDDDAPVVAKLVDVRPLCDLSPRASGVRGNVRVHFAVLQGNRTRVRKGVQSWAVVSKQGTRPSANL